MQRQTWIGIFLITLLMFLWTIWMARSSAPSASRSTSDTTSLSQGNRDTLPAEKVDSNFLFARLGRYAQFATGKDSLITVENEVARFQFSTKGAALHTHTLKNLTGLQGKPITLWDSSQKQAFIFAEGRAVISSERLYFTLVHAPPKAISTEDSVVFRLSLAPDTFIQVSYYIPADKYHFRQRIAFHNLKENLRNPYVSYTLSYQTPQTEPSTASMRPHCALYYRQAEEVESITPDEDETQQKALQGRIRWISAKGQFFCAILQANEAFSSATLTTLPFSGLPKYQIELQLPLTNDKTEQQWYLGPTRYALLRSYKEDYEKQLNLGWNFIRYINTAFIIPVFGFLEKYISSYGVIIAILALLVKILLSPLTWRSYLLGVRMQVVNELPEVKALEEKYKDQPDKLMIERSLLYRQLGVSPLSGCVPLLLQIPIFFAMTSFFPNAFELRQQGFLWTSDLSSYDALIKWGINIPLIGDHLSLFALLTALSTLAYTYIVQQGQTTTPQNLRWLSYISPVIFFIFLNDYSSALSWYYFVLNLLTIVQTLVMKQFVDKEALARKLREIQRKKQNKAQVAQQRAQMQRWFKRK
ncbi:MAG: membrane protein insertase YidC [Bacteroidia bacterium]|nr:membrane protein insertase YidC [Bacteroidia bacterium]MCX7651321.1 membrane protein insertase YidC [Bacteroidia bacterium]MDW8417159.1 membrane protein insertase YidC [Bacteroidia bacterium]